MNTFSFLVAFSAVLCGALASPQYMSGHYYGRNADVTRMSGWEEPCADQVSSTRVHYGTAADLPSLSNAVQSTVRADGAYTYRTDGTYTRDAEYTGMGGYHHHHHGYPHGERGEILIHRPAPIIVKRPPTKVLVNHPPLVVKPAPVVLHRPPPMVVRPVVVKQHPQQVKIEPVYMKVVKPTTSERVYLDDKQPCDDTYYAKPQVMPACD